MNTEQVYHYVYRITNVVLKKHYYGKRTSKVFPKEDLGIKYFSSSSDKWFIEDQKLQPQNYRYKVVRLFCTEKEAIAHEVKLHNKFDVGRNPRFFNKAIQRNNKTYFFNSKLSEEHKQKIRLSRLNKPRSEETKAKLRLANLGKKASKEAKLKMSVSRIGVPINVDRHGNKNPNAKLANIYNRHTNELIAEKVIIAEWCKLNGLDNSGMSKCAKSDKTKPHSKDNRLYYKDFYANYIEP